MAGFGRSNSLSINTGSSLFGGANASKPPFAASTTASSQPQSGGLFGSTNTPQPQQAAGLFGSTTTSQPQSGGLFSSAATASQPQQTGGLFGNLGRPTTTGGGLFGPSATQSQPQQTSSLFGSTLAQNQSQQQSGTSSLFGNLGTQGRPAATPSLFPATATTQQKPSLFSAVPAAQQPTPSLFSGMAQSTTNQSSLFGSRVGGGLSLGQHPTTAPATTVPGVKIDVSAMRGTTRFNDLHEDIQRQIEQIDTFIRQQMDYKEQCAAMMPTHSSNLSYVPNDVAFVASKVDAVEMALDNDTHAIARLKEYVKADADDARLSFRAIENLKLPQQFHYTGMMWPTSLGATSRTAAAVADIAASGSGDPNDPALATPDKVDLVPYFSKRAEALGATLDEYTRQIAEIEQHLRTVEASTMQQTEELMLKRAAADGDGTQDRLRELVETLKAFETAILNVAGKVGAAREKVVEVTVGGGSAVNTLNSASQNARWR